MRRELGVERRRPAPSIRAVTDDGGSQMGEVHADLVRAPRPEGGLDQRQRGRTHEPVDDAIARERRPARAGRAHGHPEPVAGVPTDGGLDHARRVREPAVNQRQVAPLDGPRLELAGERQVRVIVLGDREEPGGAPVQPVDDAGAPRAADAGEPRAAVGEERVDEGPRPMSRARVHDEPHRLVHHQEVGVLVDDGQRDGLGR